jgi:hypothetical protein
VVRAGHVRQVNNRHPVDKSGHSRLQVAEATGEGEQAIVIVGEITFELLGERGEQIVGQVEMSRTAVAKDLVEGFVTGEAAGPGEEVTYIRELPPLLPEGEAGLLVDVFDVGWTRQQRGDEEIDPPLVAEEFRHEGCRVVVGRGGEGA